MSHSLSVPVDKGSEPVGKWRSLVGLLCHGGEAGRREVIQSGACCISRSIMQGTWATNQLPVGTPTGNLRRESGNSRRSLGRELTLITSPSHPMDGNAWRSTGQGCNLQVLLAGCGQRGIPRLTPCTMTGGRSGAAPERQDNPFEKGCHIIRS